MSNSITPNQREILAAQSTVTGSPEYLTSTNGVLNTGATLSASSIALNDGTTTSRKATVANLTNSNPLAVEIVDGSGNQITSFGGGTQYTTGSAQATPTGTVSLGWDGTDVKALPLDGSGFLKVNVAAGGGSGGTSSSFSSAFPATGTAIGATDGTNMQPLKVDGSDNLLVNLNTALPAGTNVIGHAITDSGSVTAATQSGTWNITNISGTVSLPTGAATAAKQPALGTAGTASSDVITVQGIASMTALKVDGSATTQPVSGTVTANAGTNLNTSLLALESGGNLASIKTDVDNLNLAQASTTSGQKGNLILAAVTTSAPTYTTAQSNPLSLTTAGALRTDASATTQPVSGTVTANAGTGTFNIQSNASVNLAQLAGNTISSGVGTSGTGTLRTVVANDTGRSLQSAGGSASSSGNNTLVAAGTNKLKVYAFTLSTTSSTSVTCIFQSGASGTELWRVVLQAPTSVSTGANLVVQPPAWLFATASATLLNLNLSAAQTVHWSVSYWDEA